MEGGETGGSDEWEKSAIFPKINDYQSTEADEQKAADSSPRLIQFVTHCRDGDKTDLSAVWHFRLGSVRDTTRQSLRRVDEVFVESIYCRHDGMWWSGWHKLSSGDGEDKLHQFLFLKVRNMFLTLCFKTQRFCWGWFFWFGWEHYSLKYS